MRKKIFTVAMIAGCLMLAACGKDKKNEKPTPSTAPTSAVTDAPKATKEVTPEPTKVVEPLSYSNEMETLSCKAGDTEVLTSQIIYPVFTGENAEKFNAFVKQLVDEFKAEFEKEKEPAIKDFEEGLAETIEFPEYDNFQIALTTNLNKQYLCFFASRHTYAGGPHPNSLHYGYVVDRQTAKEIRLSEYLAPYDLSEYDAAYYAAERFKLNYENPEEVFDVDDLSGALLNLIGQHKWYLNDDGLVIFADPYDVAAYAYGMIAATITKPELEVGLMK